MQGAEEVVGYIRNATEDTKLKENASMALYQKIQRPTTFKLEKLEQKMEAVIYPFIYDRNQLAIEEPYDYQPHAIKEPKQKIPIINIYKGVNKK